MSATDPSFVGISDVVSLTLASVTTRVVEASGARVARIGIAVFDVDAALTVSVTRVARLATTNGLMVLGDADGVGTALTNAGISTEEFLVAESVIGTVGVF